MDGFILFAAIKCFGELGCFPVDGPFRSSLRPLSVSPFSPHVINSSVLLYTRQAPNSPQIFSINSVSNATFFEPWRQSKVVIHGFQEDGFTKEWIKNTVRELLKKDDFNVFVVDWANGAQMPYHQAVSNARVVGRIVARLIYILQTTRDATAESFHLIGHSLGAHIAGYAGQQTENLGRITGLDPAKPYFEGTDDVVRLDPSDASFVDVVHTATNEFWRGGMGMRSPCGHVDFYPNGGKTQPGCNGAPTITTVFNENNNLVFGMRQWLTCNHKRAHVLFTESINSKIPFTSIPCRSHTAFRNGECFGCGRMSLNCAVMGLDADKGNKPPRKVGKYFLLTSSRTPLAQLQNRITLHIGKWSGHAGSFNVRISQNQTNHKPIRVKLNTKAMNEYKISTIFTSSSTIETPKVNTKWVSEHRFRANPLTYFNGDTPRICISTIVIESLRFDREIVTTKLKPSDVCTSHNRQTFISDSI